MNLVKILIVLLSHQGHWFGGQAGVISIRWVTQSEPADAVLVWDLMFDGVRVCGDRVALTAGKQPSTLTITPPEVRVRTAMRWVYRLYKRDGGKEIDRGEETIHVYPNNMLEPLAERMAGKRIIVCDRADGLPKLLAQAGIKHNRVDQPSKLQFAQTDIILVGPDRIDSTAFIQSSLVSQAQAGAGVLIFAQPRARVLAGYNLILRKVPANLQWRTDHPLLYQFRPDDLQSLLGSSTGDLWAIHLPADEPVLEIGYWPREVPSENPVPIDALLMVKAVGAGRIVLCQIPLDKWDADPRSQLFLNNALSYLLTSPEPTVPPSQRHVEREPQIEPVPTITIPSGGKP